MLKYLTVTFLTFLYCNGNIIKSPLTYDRNLLYNNNLLMVQNEELAIADNKETLQWQSHVFDFLKLIDLEKVFSTAIRFIDDPEVMRFIGFIFGPNFREIIWDLENVEEFTEAYMFLEAKGYDVESIINAVNSDFNLPPFNKPQQILRFDKGVSGFIAAMIGALPVEEMKELLKYKLETSPEVADLFDVLNSEEFINIIKRMFENPKFQDIKSTFEKYGIDFAYICNIAQKLQGDDYQGIFCGKSEESGIFDPVNIV